MYPRGAGLSVMKLLLYTFVNGHFGDHVICEGLGLFVDADHSNVFLISDQYFEYSLLFLVSLSIVNLLNRLSLPLVPLTLRLAPFILQPKLNSISIIFYNLSALSFLKLSVA